MLQLVNLSNYSDAVKMIKNEAGFLQNFLSEHNLDGVEMMFCEPWNKDLHKKELIHGSHLWFWNDWLDFWQQDMDVLLKQYGSIEQLKFIYGGLNREHLINAYRKNIEVSRSAQVKYMVFHVSNARHQELFNWQFHFSDKAVIKTTIELVNLLVKDIPKDTMLLFENLWWPGMNLLSEALTGMLLDNIDHPCGIMLDTGHLMNTCQTLQSQEEGIDYIKKVVGNLGKYKKQIKGVHLHHSLSGEYILKSKAQKIEELAPEEVYRHVKRIDQHLPFSSPRTKELIDLIQPEYLVHEFIVNDSNDWSKKIKQQQQAILGENSFK